MVEATRKLSLEQRVGQLFCIGIAGPELDTPTRALLDEVSPGAVCLFTRNVRGANQTRTLLDDIRDTLPVMPILSVDQEGGLVDRLRRIITPMPAANKLRTEDDAAELASIISEALRLLGFNMDFAPVVDVVDAERAARTNGLFSREFGRSKEDVVSLAGRFLDTLQQSGIIGCLKHFPGLGAAAVDAHEELPQVPIPEDELSAIDLYPYRELIPRAHAVMVAHATFPASPLQERDLDGKLLPASLSYNLITTLLRDGLGFSGLVITDDLEMGAIVKNYGIGDACVRAVKAGVDQLAICADPEKIRTAYARVLEAVRAGEIADESLNQSLSRIAEFKERLAEPLPFDIDKLDALSSRVGELNARLAD